MGKKFKELQSFRLVCFHTRGSFTPESKVALLSEVDLAASY